MRLVALAGIESLVTDNLKLDGLVECWVVVEWQARCWMPSRLRVWIASQDERGNWSCWGIAAPWMD